MSELGNNIPPENNTIASSKTVSSDQFTDTKNNSMGKNFGAPLSMPKAQDTGYTEHGTIPIQSMNQNNQAENITTNSTNPPEDKSNSIIGDDLKKDDTKNKNNRKVLIGIFAFIWISVGAYYFLGGNVNLSFLQGNLMNSDTKYTSSLDDVENLKDDGLQDAITNQIDAYTETDSPVSQIPKDNMDSLFLNNIQSEPSIQTNVIKTEQIPKTNYDTDNDGVFDDVEKIFGTDINNPDTDNDGISDMQELEVYKTDPLIADTDNDGVNDIDEILAGTDPNNKFE